MSMKYSNVGRNPLLEPDKIDNVLTYFPHNPNVTELAEFLPLVNYDTEKVQMDFAKPYAGGMTPAVADMTESPIYGGFGRGYLEFEATTFREKVVLMEADLENLREIGTKDQLVKAQDMLRQKFAGVETRLLNRLEWMRRQLLFENQVSVDFPESGANYTVAYGHGAHLEPVLTSTDTWDSHTTADPLIDLQTWVETYLLNTDFGVSKIVLPMGLMVHLQANKRFQDALNSNFPLATASSAQITEQLKTYIGLAGPVPITTSYGKLNYHPELIVDAAQGASSIVLSNTGQLEAGDKITIVRAADLHRELLEVASVSGNTVTLAAAIDTTGGFRAKDPVRYYKPIIPFDRILIAGKFNGVVDTVGLEKAPDADLIQRWGEVASVLSRYVDFTSPKSGIFTKTIDKIANEDVSRLEQVIGIKALPKLNYPDGWMAPKVM